MVTRKKLANPSRCDRLERMRKIRLAVARFTVPYHILTLERNNEMKDVWENDDGVWRLGRAFGSASIQTFLGAEDERWQRLLDALDAYHAVAGGAYEVTLSLRDGVLLALDRRGEIIFFDDAGLRDFS